MICYNIREHFDQVYKKNLDKTTPDDINKEINNLINHSFITGEALNSLIYETDFIELEEIFEFAKKTYENIDNNEKIKMLKSIYPYDIDYKELKGYGFNFQFACFSNDKLAELIKIEKEFYNFDKGYEKRRGHSLKELIQDVKLAILNREKEVAKLLGAEKLDFNEITNKYKATITKRDIYCFNSNYFNLNMSEKEQIINQIFELNPYLFTLSDLSDIFNMITTYVFEKLNLVYDNNNTIYNNNNVNYVNNKVIYKIQFNKYLLLNINKIDCQMRELINNDKFSNVRELYYNYVVNILGNDLKNKILEATNEK
ncbi:hypothetical protein [Campylobacter sp. RM12651]|uniref:hypothetical protein n=1 Tax=Campylobacter sp. RM12651 TaxID=1660079 RepID=UPI001EFBF86E|nr:hypothetical protein [Campylobacter sp. RM12651]ULO04566.1 hypothetical protein AVBRAN_a0084 [Campylobacter sp. RM12651]